eukprot:scaffold2329_cov247-Pinguiococcus_pyrenoidosus.AAC.2
MSPVLTNRSTRRGARLTLSRRNTSTQRGQVVQVPEARLSSALIDSAPENGLTASVSHARLLCQRSFAKPAGGLFSVARRSLSSGRTPSRARSAQVNTGGWSSRSALATPKPSPGITRVGSA